MPKQPRPRPTTADVTEPARTTHKLNLHASYAAQSPFPEFTRPRPGEPLAVLNILSEAHAPDGVPRTRPLPSANAAESCGDVPDVIEALIGTILSQNTSAQNSSAAKASLDARFGRNNFAAMAEAPRAAVVDAIRRGGLANKKAGVIQNILRAVREAHGAYSLQHLARGVRSNDEIMRELMSYDGVGPKTASCVLLFCLGRDSFAVDTHVYRLSRLLGWVPGKADRVLAQAHLDLRIPDELKYGLHVLMIQHGRVCKGCRKSASGDCVLKMYVRRRAAVDEAAKDTID